MDIKLYYREKGTGEPLILLHGNGENGEYFVHQMEYFSKRYRVIAVDTRGHGLSPRGGGPFTIRQFAEDLCSFMEENHIESANLLGFSDGANIAMIFAMKYPERVKKLILNGGNLNAKGVKPSVQIPIEIGYKMASMFAKKSPQAMRNAEMLRLMVKDPDIDPAELAAVRLPALVIAGTGDMIKQSHTELIYKSLPDARLAIIEGNHFIANKNAKEFNARVEEFLEGSYLVNDDPL